MKVILTTVCEHCKYETQLEATEIEVIDTDNDHKPIVSFSYSLVCCEMCNGLPKTIRFSVKGLFPEKKGIKPDMVKRVKI